MYKRNRYQKRKCGCMNQPQSQCPNCQMPEFMPENPQLASAYVPYQEQEETFCPAESLMHGTTFPELVRPYRKNQSQSILQYLRGTTTCGEVDARD